MLRYNKFINIIDKWTSQQYHDAIQELINDQRKDLRKGRTKLHCEGGYNELL